MTAFLEPAVARYIALANRTPALDREQELRLARAARAGDESARGRFIAASLRHVIPHALRYRHLGVPLGELIAQGNLGLMLALGRFEPSHGLRFSTYANHWIRSEMLLLIRRGKSVVNAGRSRGWLRQYDASLDAPNPGGQLEIEPVCEARQEDLLARARSNAELSCAVTYALSDFSPRERYLVEHRLMADPEVRQSLAEIGSHFGVSRERARQIEHKLKERLRTRLHALVGRLELLEAA